jgi:hypothetical protein
MKNSLKFIIILAFFVTLSLSLVNSQELSRQQLSVDQSLYEQDENVIYQKPRSIVILPITPPSDNWNVSDEDWYRGIYYYLLGRKSLGDIPFHYVVTSDGVIINGANNGVEQSIDLIEGPENPIILAYLDSRFNNSFNTSVITPLNNKILELSNLHKIESEDIYVQGIEFIEEDNRFKLQSIDIGGRYQNQLDNIRSFVEDNYDPINKRFEISVSAELPDEPVEPNSDTSIQLSVTNNGEYSIFHGSDNEFFLSKADNSNSIFYKNGVWASRTSYQLMEDGDILRPGETKTYNVELDIPLFFGPQSEEFELINSNGGVYPQTKVNIELEIATIDEQIVEVLDTETGSLNVRQAPGGEVFTSVLPGQRFIELDRTQNGWVQIQLDEGEGWVSNRYVRSL